MDKDKIQKRIINSLQYPAHGVLDLAPRIGKTKIGIDICLKEDPLNILWVTPSSQLRDVDIPAEFDKWAPELKERLTCVTYKSLHKIKGYYEKVILDEHQEVTDLNTSNFFTKDLTYGTILCLSGTPPEHYEKNEIYRKLKLNTLYRIDIDEAVSLGVLAPYNITVHTVKMNKIDKTERIKTKKYDFRVTEYKRYEYLNKTVNKAMFNNESDDRVKYMLLNRMRFIHNSVTKLTVAKLLLKRLKGRTLYFASSIKQCEALSDYTYHSKVDDTNLNAFLDGKIDTLGCVNSGGVGFTFKNVDNFVIIQANSNKKGDVTQKIARSLLLQVDYSANIHIICLEDTVDLNWVNKVLESFDDRKITWRKIVV